MPVRSSGFRERRVAESVAAALATSASGVVPGTLALMNRTGWS